MDLYITRNRAVTNGASWPAGWKISFRNILTKYLWGGDQHVNQSRRLDAADSEAEIHFAYGICPGDIEMKQNPWVWTKKAQDKKPDRVAGDPVPIGYLAEGYSEYYPPASWVHKGYIEKIERR